MGGMTAGAAHQPKGDAVTDAPYVVMTMCHCEEFTDDGKPEEDCYDHWMVGIPKSGYQPSTGHVGIATDTSGSFRTRTDAQMFADAKNGDGR